MNEKEKCFVIMPFSTPGTYDDVDHFTKIYEQVFAPAIKKAGYEPYRVDQDKISDSIIGKIFDAVRTCPMALCDLSSRNPNVLYELGLRQAYNLPVVLVQDDMTEKIFDVSGISTVEYKSHRLVENVEDARNKISEAIIQTRDGQNKTLANIVKAQGADYESIEVGKDDHIEILLKTLTDDMKEMKREILKKQHSLNEEMIARSFGTESVYNGQLYSLTAPSYVVNSQLTPERTPFEIKIPNKTDRNTIKVNVKKNTN